jgi:ribosome assembly protein 4
MHFCIHRPPVYVLTCGPKDREDFTPYRFRIHIPGKDVIIDQYPTDLLALLQKHGVTNPFECVPDPPSILHPRG